MLLYLIHNQISLTEYQNLLRDVGSLQSVHGSGQSSSGSPAADTGIIHFGRAQAATIIIIAPSHEEHLNVKIVKNKVFVQLN